MMAEIKRASMHDAYTRNRRGKRPLHLLMLGLIWLGMTTVWPVTSQAASDGLHFTRTTLKNGLTVLYKVMKNEPLVSIYAVFPIGMNREKAKGIAHLLEHVVFRGGSGYNFTDIAEVTTRKGGQFNGFTSFDTTSYNFVVPRENLSEGLRIFNGIVWKPITSGTALELEKKIVIHELDMDYSERYQEYPVYRYFYPEFSYSQASVAAITSQDLEEFHRQFYQPDQATYVLAGDFDPRQVLPELEKLGNGYGGRIGAEPETTGFDLPDRDLVEERNLYPYQYQILMAYQFNGMTPQERMVLKLLANLYRVDAKIDYEKNEYRLYNTIYRNVGARDYFGIYYLERSHPYSEAVFKEDQAALSKYFREFAAIDLRQSLEDTIRQINLAAASSEQSASAAVEYEVTRLTDPDTLTIDDIPLLKKIKTKDLQAVLDKYFNQPPRCWILVHSNYQDGGDRDATSRK